MDERYEVETMRKVFDNELGAHIKVGPDADGLKLVEIEGGEDFGCGRITLDPRMALVLAGAIEATARELLA